MKIFLVLLLCTIAAKQWIACEASRKFSKERMEAESSGGLFPVPKKIMLEAVDEANAMETEFMLPDESKDEKPDIIIEEEKNRSNQQKDSLMEALEEQTSNEKKHQEDEPSLSENGDDDLLLDESQEEKLVQERPKKKKKKDSENDSSGRLTGEKWQAEEKGRKKPKNEKNRMVYKFLRQPSEEVTPANAEKEEKVESFSGEASLADIAATEMETGIGDFPSEPGEEQADSTFVKEEIEKEQTAVVLKKHKPSTEDEAIKEDDAKAVVLKKHKSSIEDEVTKHYKEDDAKAEERTKKDEVEGTEKAEKAEKRFVFEDPKSKVSRVKDSKTKRDEVEEAVTANKGEKVGVLEGSKRKISDDKDLTGEDLPEEITDEETPADLIVREMQGGVEDLVSIASKERKGGGAKQQTKDEAHTPDVNVNETEGGDVKVKPLNKLKMSKKPKSETIELKGLTASETEIKTKVQKREESQSELENVITAKVGETSDVQLKQVDMEDTAKSKMKKKKKAKSDKLKKEENLNEKAEKNFDVLQNEEMFSGKAKEKSPKKSIFEEKFEQEEKHSTDADMEEGLMHQKSTNAEGVENIQELKILEVTDSSKARGTSKEKGVANEKISEGSEDELPTIEKQEEKLEIEVHSIAKEAQEIAEGSSSPSKLVSSSIQGLEEEDDEYSDFMQEFSDLSTKFQDTALKVADHLGPNIQKLTDTSKNYFKKANQQITDSFSPLVGKQLAPFFASLLSYGLLLVPLAVVILLFEHIRALLPLQKVILFANVYLAAYFATLLLTTFIMGEPMNFFYRSSASNFVYLQLLQALGYIIYLILQTTDLVSSCYSEACPVKVTVMLQWFVAVTIGFHYYLTVFHRAMALKGPHTNWKIYGVYSSAFLLLCLFARIKRVKKGYLQVGQVDADKKH